MNTVKHKPGQLLKLFQDEKVVTISEMKTTLGTNSTMTIFRKLKQLNYRSSCSHSGKYYTLKRFIKFNDDGLWFFNSVLFSMYRSLADTIKALIDNSERGYTSRELNDILKVKPNESLVNLINSKRVYREKISGKFVYFSINKAIKKQQEMLRKDVLDANKLTDINPDVLMNELKAAIIIFYSILNEKQRRLFAGLESMKIGRGGDTMIAELLGLNIKTVAKGRKELLSDVINVDTIREPGGGRKTIVKKNK